MRHVAVIIICFLLGCDSDLSESDVIKSESIAGVLKGEFVERGITDRKLMLSGVIGKLTDIDGNTYPWVRIGKQIWMAENLRSTRYCDGSPIKETEIHDNDTLGIPGLGKLYSIGAAANTDLSSSNPSNVPGACPCGWHLPSRSEFQEMLKVVNSNKLPIEDVLVSNRLRTSDKINGGFWCDGKPDYEGDNLSGFSALPAGRGSKWGESFTIMNMFSNTYFWTSEPSYYNEIKRNDVYTVFSIGKGVNYNSPLLAFIPVTTHLRVSVRCVKNQ